MATGLRKPAYGSWTPSPRKQSITQTGPAHKWVYKHVFPQKGPYCRDEVLKQSPKSFCSLCLQRIQPCQTSLGTVCRCPVQDNAAGSSQASPKPCRPDDGSRAGQGEVYPGSNPTGPQTLVRYNGDSNT